MNALRIGRKSGRVIVTGGEDRKVNVWAVGKTGAIMVCLNSGNTFIQYQTNLYGRV